VFSFERSVSSKDITYQFSYGFFRFRLQLHVDSKCRQVRCEIGIELGVIACIAINVSFVSARYYESKRRIHTPAEPSAVMVPSLTHTG
jgi:hypothetical protein